MLQHRMIGSGLLCYRLAYSEVIESHSLVEIWEMSCRLGMCFFILLGFCCFVLSFCLFVLMLSIFVSLVGASDWNMKPQMVSFSIVQYIRKKQ